ncbi:MAG: hypothetical protein QM679_12425, partial [Patulibacter sp.]
HERASPDVPGDQRWHATLQIRSGWLLSGAEDALLAALNGALPLGVQGHLVIADHTTYVEVAEIGDYAAVAASVDDYADLLDS